MRDDGLRLAHAHEHGTLVVQEQRVGSYQLPARRRLFHCDPAGKLRVCKFVSSPPVRLLGRTDAAGGQVHEEGGHLATPHMVFTDNCQDRRYLSETAGNAITTRSGSVGELSGSSSSTGRSDHPRGLDRLCLEQRMWLEDEEYDETRWDRR